MPRAKKAKKEKTVNQRSSNEQDNQIGARIRAMRIDRGMSQEEMGKRLGVSFQQVQKYEKGVNRIAATRLAQVADILQTTLEQLYDRKGPQLDGLEFDIESYKLAKAFSKLPDHLKSKIRSLINSIVDEAA
jgi:transcriptional regulator with XRE-family HTH domain